MTPEHELESEEDEAPEEVTFQSARSRAEESARARREEATREKALLKEKRKRKEELFKEQKKKKLLPDDILQSISTLPEKRDESSPQEDQNKTEVKSSLRKKPRKKKLLPQKRLQNNYKVAQLEEYSSNAFLRNRAETFLKRKIFGSSQKRTTVNEFLSISNKRSAVKKPAVLFTDDSWDKETKRKATKLNLQWMDRKKH